MMTKKTAFLLLAMAMLAFGCAHGTQNKSDLEKSEIGNPLLEDYNQVKNNFDLEKLETEKTLLEEYNQDQNDFDAFKDLINYYIEVSQLDAAISALNDNLSSGDNEAWIYRKLGNAYFSKGNYELSKSMLEKSAALNSSDPLTYVGLARLYNTLNDSTKAIEMVNAALKLEPDSEHPLIVLGDIYLKNDEYNLANEVYPKILNNDIENSQTTALAYSGIGRVRYKQGEFDAAEEMLLKSIQLYPNQPWTYIVLGNVYYDQGDLEKAAQTYDLALNLNPNLQEQIAAIKKERNISD